MSGHEPHYRGLTDVWLTPKPVIDTLGPFDLDPFAASEPRPWPTAKRHITKEQDGLKQYWGGSEIFVWCNPPYGPEAGACIGKLADHGNGIALVFARTETKWFQAIIPRATSLFFPRGRLTFCRADGTVPKGNGGAPSVFVAFGDEAHRRLERAAFPGFFAKPMRGVLSDLL